ncbi:hypothetical protein [Aminivibrio sp.]|jgi:hypothetical protein|uniref:hypothetical protein n=1 Tax=Aminivibrio sp. TaxID=1872489 RepID=UPI003D952A07
MTTIYGFQGPENVEILTNLQPIIIVEAFPEGGLCFHLAEIKAFLPENLSFRGKESCEQI